MKKAYESFTLYDLLKLKNRPFVAILAAILASMALYAWIFAYNDLTSNRSGVDTSNNDLLKKTETVFPPSGYKVIESNFNDNSSTTEIGADFNSKS